MYLSLSVSNGTTNSHRVAVFNTGDTLVEALCLFPRFHGMAIMIPFPVLHGTIQHLHHGFQMSESERNTEETGKEWQQQ